MSLCTEEEAKERWCPFARATLFAEEPDGEVTVIAGAPTFNRFAEARASGPTNPPSCRCIGSQCMAWRWGDDDAALNERMHGREATPELGYCGLAGKP